ncbi:unnamed protein product [Callosobruchus maculatus]|uniref:Gamma tubulin complex component C-terminal domain-containing protein n=1 Tax=Callosobruchus maculatus TaxID=64391 RepID=A0A653DVA8_CALMS|nr:unnamed protein product [Callosobruchus maculatus]
MDDDDSDGVFGLITKLCEKFYKDPDEIKASRSRCYEIILKKRVPKYKKSFKDLKGVKDPSLNLLSWIFQLVHGYGLQEYGEKVLKAAEKFRACYEDDPETYKNILYFLLNFRKVPKRDENKWDLSTLPSFDFKHEEDKLHSLFILPESLQQECDDYFSNTFYLDSDALELGQVQFPKQSTHETLHVEKQNQNTQVEVGDHSEDEGISDDDVWEMAAKEPFCNRRTWESFGYAEPDKEQPFLSELGDLSSLWVENLETLYMVPLFREEAIFKSKMIPRKTFIMNLKYLLAGMASDCFGLDDSGGFYLDSSISVEGITPDTLKAYCQPLLVCGSCHRALEKMCTPNPDTGKYKYEGYIFLEFCGSIKRYLQFHQTAVFSISCSSNFLEFHKKTRQLRLQHSALASVCKKVVNVTEQQVALVLTYWTRSYSICEDIMPDFLVDLKNDILYCGKSMMLLKVCNSSEQRIKRLDEMNALKEQYDMALEQVRLNEVKEIQEDMKLMQENIKIEERRQKLIKEEADKMIDYYTKLYEQAERKKALIENHVKVVKSIHMNQTIPTENAQETPCIEDTEKAVANSSNESFYSLNDDKEPESEKEQEIVEVLETEPEKEDEVYHDSVTKLKIHSSESMDILNANTEDQTKEKEPETKTIPPHVQTMIDNFKLARQIKHKVMTQEMGIDFSASAPHSTETEANVTPCLTDAQKNKLRILSSEFGIEVKDVKRLRMSKAAQSNKDKILGTSDCFHYLDNADFVNKNLEEPMKKSKSLTLELNTKSSKVEIDRPIPMSVDSTPQSEFSTSTIYVNTDINQLSLTPTTARTESDIHYLNDFPFDHNQNQACEVPTFFPKMVFSKRVNTKVARGISTNCLSLFLEESIHIPLVAQTKIVNSELLRYFIDDLKYIDHLHSLRDYFFLLDCEFGRNVTDTLFSRLYESSAPSEVISYRMLKELLYRACDVSGKNQDNSQRLSFRMTGMPKRLDLGDPNVLDFISLTYKVQWPLNILLPVDTISKYDEVFKFLLKLCRVSWVLKKIFLELKSLAKEMGEKEIYLMSSPQYRRLHQHRHIMTQFVQTLQDYIVGEVLQASWDSFEKELCNATNLDELYSLHVSYVKKIIIMCMLHQKMAALKAVIHKIFVVVLKFYDYLRSRLWVCENGAYIHPNFEKLDSIFKNFEELVAFFFKVARKVGKCGLQPHLLQLLDMLDVNNYYSKNSISLNKCKK